MLIFFNPTNKLPDADIVDYSPTVDAVKSNIESAIQQWIENNITSQDDRRTWQNTQISIDPKATISTFLVTNITKGGNYDIHFKLGLKASGETVSAQITGDGDSEVNSKTITLSSSKDLTLQVKNGEISQASVKAFSITQSSEFSTYWTDIEVYQIQ